MCSSVVSWNANTLKKEGPWVPIGPRLDLDAFRAVREISRIANKSLSFSASDIKAGTSTACVLPKASGYLQLTVA